MQPPDPSWLLVGGGLAGLASTFVVHPLSVWLAALGRRDPPPPPLAEADLPGLSVVVAFSGGGDLLRGKIEDLLALDYPADRLEAIFVRDGAALAGDDLPEAARARGWRRLATGRQEGKNAALDLGVGEARFDILLFTDLDARLGRDAARRLAGWFADPATGLVCGQRAIGEHDRPLDEAQSRYIDLDSRLKLLESRLGFLTSNDGKLYAMRRALYRPLPGPVTDDLFNALSVARQGARLVFEPRAIARIRKPSRDSAHELTRRRRIVARSLYGIWLNRAVLDPTRHGLMATGLLFNKVFRRLMPVFLLLILGGSLSGALAGDPWLGALCAAQAGAYGLTGLFALLPEGARRGRLGRLAAHALYVVIGNLGMLLGVIDFLLGRRVSRWTPVKAD